jgi:hypothetical protein
MAVFVEHAAESVTSSYVKAGELVGSCAPVGAENLCHQAIFMNHTSGAVAPPDAESV